MELGAGSQWCGCGGCAGRAVPCRRAAEAGYRGVAVSLGAWLGPRAGEWTQVRVSMESLMATVRGSPLQGVHMDPSRVREIGLLIADKREGAFALAVDWIAVE